MLGWVTAHLATDPFGNAPIKQVDGGAGAPANGMIEASEAYAYAASVGVAHPKDEPACKDAPPVAVVALAGSIPAAGDIRLLA